LLLPVVLFISVSENIFKQRNIGSVNAPLTHPIPTRLRKGISPNATSPLEAPLSGYRHRDTEAQRTEDLLGEEAGPKRWPPKWTIVEKAIDIGCCGDACLLARPTD